MKKILLTFNQLNDSNGVARCAVAIANILAQHKDLSITLRPLYRSDELTEKTIDDTVQVKPVFNFYFPGFAKILSMIPASWLYRWTFQKEHYDIEIAFQYGIATYIIGSRHAKDNIYRLAWMHCYDEELKYRQEYMNVDKVVCVSQCNKERLEIALGAAGHIDVCYNPINDREIVSMGEEQIDLQPNETLQFVTVGSLRKIKGFARLIDCIKKLQNNGHDCSLWIVGPGEEYENLESKIRTLGLETSVALVGGQSNPHKYVSKADVFVCSSYVEGYSTACTEAVMLGVPVISTPVSGAAEIIKTANCGLISKDLETDSLYEIMEQTASHPQEIERWKSILKETRKNFSQSSRVDKLYKILGI